MITVTATLNVVPSTFPAPFFRKSIPVCMIWSQLTSRELNQLLICSSIRGLAWKLSVNHFCILGIASSIWRLRLTMVLPISGINTTRTIQMITITSRMDSMRLAGLANFFAFPCSFSLPKSLFSRACIGTLRIKAMAPPKIKGNTRCQTNTTPAATLLIFCTPI